MKRSIKTPKPMTLKDVTIVEDSKLRKVITAAALGNGIEWFDFGVYGYLATALGKAFFPDASSSVQLIATLGTFSVPFFIRPLGGMFFGVLGDKYGRQGILALTILLMSISTACIGLIPSYATIGVFAPILLLLCKMVQGFSVGGEYTGASVFVAEYSPDRKRGFLGSFLDFGFIVGFLLGAGLVELLSVALDDAAMVEWGWRIPFLLSLPLGMIGLFLRNKLEETPAFQKSVERLEQGDKQGLQHGPRVSFGDIVRKYWRAMLTCFGLVVTMNIALYILLTYMPSYLTHNLGYSESSGTLIITAAMVGMVFIQPTVGLLSDRFGRRPFFLTGTIGLFLFATPAFYLIQSGHPILVFLGMLGLTLFINCITGVVASTLPALFPTEVRYSALASVFNVAIIVAGVTPTVAAWLVNSTDNLMMPAYYVMGASVLGIFTGYKMIETANRPMRGATPTASDIEEARALLQKHYNTLEERIEGLDEEIEELQRRRARLIAQHPHITDN